MNIFQLPLKDFEKKLDEIFKNKSPKELLKELKDCGLKTKEED